MLFWQMECACLCYLRLDFVLFWWNKWREYSTFWHLEYQWVDWTSFRSKIVGFFYLIDLLGKNILFSCHLAMLFKCIIMTHDHFLSPYSSQNCIALLFRNAMLKNRSHLHSFVIFIICVRHFFRLHSFFTSPSFAWHCCIEIFSCMKLIFWS